MVHCPPLKQATAPDDEEKPPMKDSKKKDKKHRKADCD